jgi:hypothetical protein
MSSSLSSLGRPSRAAEKLKKELELMDRKGINCAYQSTEYRVQNTLFRVSVVNAPNEKRFWLWCKPRRCDSATAIPL